TEGDRHQPDVEPFPLGEIMQRNAAGEAGREQIRTQTAVYLAVAGREADAEREVQDVRDGADAKHDARVEKVHVLPAALQRPRSAATTSFWRGLRARLTRLPAEVR